MTLGSHQKTIGSSQVHITPRWILDPLGPFDLDPCAADPRPWDCARASFAEGDDGLARTWFGRVWLNPPFNRYLVGHFIARLAAHGRGTALLHARTETAWFRQIWDGATALLFLFNRIIFCKHDGSPQTTRKGEIANSGAPPVLAAFGDDDAEILAFCGLDGQFVPLIVSRKFVGLVLPLGNRSWREIVAEWLAMQTGPVSVADVYRAFAAHPKIEANPHWREKLRQTLARGAGRRIARDQWMAV